MEECKSVSDLPARGGWWPPKPGRGAYVCRCTSGVRHCGRWFQGGKKSCQCADCAYITVGSISLDDWTAEATGLELNKQMIDVQVSKTIIDDLTKLVIEDVEATRNETHDMNDDFVEDLLAHVVFLQSKGVSNVDIIKHLETLKELDEADDSVRSV